MKSLKFTQAGGEFFAQDDLVWALDGLKEAIANGLIVGGADSFIIWGIRPATLVGGFVGHTAGAVLFHGEVCLVDADTIGIDPAVHNETTWSYETILSNDPAGNIAFATGGPYDMYGVKKVQIVYDPTPPGDAIAYLSMPRIETLLGQLIALQPVQFESTIGLAQGTGALTGSQAILDANGNIFPITFTDGNTLTNIVGPVLGDEIGTQIYLRFVGTNPMDQIIVGGAGITTQAGLTYAFRNGDWAMFTYQGSNVWALMTKANSAWIPLDSGNLINGWTAVSGYPPAYRINKNDELEFKGSLTTPSGFSPGSGSGFIVLPAAYRPKQTAGAPFIGWNGTIIVFLGISIDTAGNAALSEAGGSVSSVDLDGVSVVLA